MRALASFALVVVLVATGCRARELDDADRAAIAAVLSEQASAWNRGDLAAFMAAYERSDALVFTSGAEIRRGWQATHDRYVARYGGDAAARSEMGALVFEILDVRGLGADGAIVLGTWTLTDTPKAGTGVFSLGMLRTPDGWRIVHDHTSARVVSSPPP
ncbi:MAG TPA: nuclear transport factor 2 family protein [Nannocystaceae bacterium]|nr:nuclear transport factor 2 family protein [Nannocystaceae bacterium]